jgi:hypothetical protein
LVADHTLFGQTRNISGATQKDVIPRLSEYKAQFIDPLNRPFNEVIHHPPADTEKDGPSVATPSGIKGNEEIVSQPYQLEKVPPLNEKKAAKREQPPLSKLELPKRRWRYCIWYPCICTVESTIHELLPTKCVNHRHNHHEVITTSLLKLLKQQMFLCKNG